MLVRRLPPPASSLVTAHAAHACRHVPALLVYHDGELQARIFGLDEFGGARATVECVEWVLSKKGALTTELEDDPRKALRTSGLVGGAGTRRMAYGSDDDDDE